MEEENKGKGYGGIREEGKSWFISHRERRQRDYCWKKIEEENRRLV